MLVVAGPQDVIGQMVQAGLEQPPQPLDLSGRVQRFGPKRNQWYSLREIRTQAGSYVLVGAFGDWRGQQRHRVTVDWQGLRDDERAAIQAQRQAHAEAQQRERERAAADAAMSASELWQRAARRGHSPYLERKGVDAEGCRFLRDGAIAVPLVRLDEPPEAALKALQIIRADGTKRFTRGFMKAGVSCRLGLPAAGEPLLVCEGYATGLTLRMAVQRRLAVVVALDAGNLQPVVELLRRLYPQHPLLICADDDWRTAGNPGRDKAWAAARAVSRCMVTYPVFRPGMRAPKDTDFNDLHMREGLHMVHRQLRMVLPVLGQTLAPKEAGRAA